MSELTPILVPLINTNESDSLLADLPIKERQFVKPGMVIAVFETTKSTFELTADRAGYVLGLNHFQGETLRTGDLLARWGGEEFALLMPATDEAEAATILERLQEATPSGQSFSAGVTVERFRPGFDVDLDAVTRAADRAMYQAKEEGRNRIQCAPGPAAAV